MARQKKQPLSVTHPDVAAQWHPAKNGKLGPSDVFAGSHKRVWWKCPKADDHEWLTKIVGRTRSRTGCPCCGGRQASVTNSLASLHPEIAADWHSAKNGELTPADVASGSHRKVWWSCPVGEDHEWEASIVKRCSSGRGCPYCAGKKVSTTNSLASLFPEIATEWHPVKNGNVTPEDVVAGSGKRYWWKCAHGEDHEWDMAICDRTKKQQGCPCCSGMRVSVTNSLASLFPDIAKEWHPTKNGDVTPEDVIAGSNKKFWWKCAKAEDHEWESTLGNRTGNQSGCPCCSGMRVSVTNSLASLFPDIAKEWHPTKNGDVTPEDVVAGSNKKFWWKCPKGEDHEWEAGPNARTGSQSGCPCCRGLRVSVTNSLASLFPEIAEEWHPTKNGEVTPEDVVAGSNKMFWWKCAKAEDHEWEADPNARTGSQSGCPCCSGLRVSVTNSLASLFPEIAKEWHPTKNGEVTPEDVVAGSSKKFWWKCPKGVDHEWEATLGSRTHGGNGCPCCSGRRLSRTNSLASLFPEIAADWHPTKNRELTPADIVSGSNRRVWWRCPVGEDHEWEAVIAQRTSGGFGCPVCNSGWTMENVRRFVRSLLKQDLLFTLSPAELFLLSQQNGLSAKSQRRSEFAKALTSGRLSPDDLQEFANADAGSKLETLFGDLSAEELTEGATNDLLDEHVDVEVVSSDIDLDAEQQLPEVSAGATLDSLESDLWSTADEEAVDFLIASGIAKLWKRAYDPDHLNDVKDETETHREIEYSERVRSQFRDELDAAESLPIPDGYKFQIDGEPIIPNLMQRHVAAQVRDRRRVGNWSGTGAGKTLSAVLASRVVDADLTVILCPNAVIHNGWTDTILNAFPTARLATKTLAPDWPSGDGPRYLILNYETLQQPTSEPRLAEFLKANRVDCVVVDEIHYAKQRTEEASRRRRLTTALCAGAAETNPQLAVLGMSATPVINNLREGVSMVELISGVEHSDLQTVATVNNCMKIHQRLVRLGTRWMPPYPEFGKQNPRVDVSHVVDEIRALPKGSSGLLNLEQILVEQKLDCILEHVEDGTLIYSEYVDGIVPALTKALIDAGWKVGRYTGQDKTGLAPFLKGELNVLIGSSSVGTGVDGLQHRARKLIIACPPWTAAAYEQLVGRLVRQGQQQPVEVVFPITFAEVNGEEWSWCQSRLNRIEYKKSIADAAVDGIVPTGHLRSPAQAFKDAVGWLERLDGGEVSEIKRARIVVPLSDEPVEVERRVARYGDFSVMNNRWNSTGSGKLHSRLHEDPTEWSNYHTLYREARAEWTVVPFEKIGDWINQLPKNRTIGDFGCGEDLLGQRLREDGYLVHSFDHVAISDDVVRCDIGDGVPLDDSEIDVAVFSLSMMGATSGDYLREAARTLVFDGRLIICEASSRLPEDDEIRTRLEQLGFHVTDISHDAQFTFIQAIRTDREPETEVALV
ncbi:MAG: zinc-ribbon domain-containing protein [Fuerstiella sp.]